MPLASLSVNLFLAVREIFEAFIISSIASGSVRYSGSVTCYIVKLLTEVSL